MTVNLEYKLKYHVMIKRRYMNKILVLMSTYNGEKYLQQQIDSILKQQNVDVHLLVRDDGSTDQTIEILKQNALNDKIEWYTGKNLGPALSFIDLIMHAPEYDYYAFSDQDDYWLPEKLENAINHMSENKPGLYYSSTILVDKNLKKLKTTKKEYVQSLDMNSAVISSNCTGCTVCFNKYLMDYLKKYRPQYVAMHDSWVHKVCIALDGKIYYDNNSYIYYRQHENNAVGGKISAYRQLKNKFAALTKNKYQRSNEVKELLKGYGDDMSKYNLKLCQNIALYRSSLKKQMTLLFNRKLSTGNRKTDFMFKLAIILRIY